VKILPKVLGGGGYFFDSHCRIQPLYLWRGSAWPFGRLEVLWQKILKS